MQPMGRKPKIFNFVDCHPQKGYKNWWEDICDHSSDKKSER